MNNVREIAPGHSVYTRLFVHAFARSRTLSHAAAASSIFLFAHCSCTMRAQGRCRLCNVGGVPASPEQVAITVEMANFKPPLAGETRVAQDGAIDRSLAVLRDEIKTQLDPKLSKNPAGNDRETSLSVPFTPKMDSSLHYHVLSRE